MLYAKKRLINSISIFLLIALIERLVFFKKIGSFLSSFISLISGLSLSLPALTSLEFARRELVFNLSNKSLRTSLGVDSFKTIILNDLALNLFFSEFGKSSKEQLFSFVSFLSCSNSKSSFKNSVNVEIRCKPSIISNLPSEVSAKKIRGIG